MRSLFMVTLFVSIPFVNGLAADSSEVRDEAASTSVSALEPENVPSSKLAVLSDKELTELLGLRLEGGMGGTFGQFANMFLVSSRLNLGTGIGLMSENSKVAKNELRSPFPETYAPTLREFLDAIALQTSTEWKYETTGKFFKSTVKMKGPVTDLAIFEFTKVKREKPFTVKVAEGWKANDKGNWMMYVPPEFPVGMDIYEMGTYSTDDKVDPKMFLDEIRSSMALEWANRVNPKAVLKDLNPVKIGTYDALSYDTLLKGQNGKEMRWRHWVLMVGNQCYFIVSTIVPRLEDAIFPDVEEMLASFTVKE